MCTELSYPTKELQGVRTPIIEATPAFSQPPGFVNEKMTSWVLPRGDVTHRVTMTAAQPARCMHSMTPSIRGNLFAKWMLKKAPPTNMIRAKSVGSHWLFAAAEFGWYTNIAYLIVLPIITAQAPRKVIHDSVTSHPVQ
jgi:hypothetical protein